MTSSAANTTTSVIRVRLGSTKHSAPPNSTVPASIDIAEYRSHRSIPSTASAPAKITPAVTANQVVAKASPSLPLCEGDHLIAPSPPRMCSIITVANAATTTYCSLSTFTAASSTSPSAGRPPISTPSLRPRITAAPPASAAASPAFSASHLHN